MRRAIFAVLVTAAGLMLLLAFKPHEIASAQRPPAALSGATAGTRASPGTDTTASSGNDSGSSESGTRTVTGDAVDTRWGPVQVRITLSGNKITAVDAVVVPDSNGRDREINSFAVPILTHEALAAQSAQIDTVSGATYTSQGYAGSLQSALDKAGV
ncbi:FMN-binding protein [Sphaerisporangium sp. NPDC088356]|uniref:FMN-binding protein n=1 Tax=Sphaerisporangium sp. NPDC088356 TaxID=3154871 RepID=UPI003423CC1F